jgi:hypothetical protein
MTGCSTVTYRLLFLIFFSAALSFLQTIPGSAQSFLGKAKLTCIGPITILTPHPVVVRPFQVELAAVNLPFNPTSKSTEIQWQCGNVAQPNILCPGTPNRIAIDRSQGDTLFFIACLGQ